MDVKTEILSLNKYLEKEIKYYKSLLNYSKMKNEALIGRKLEDVNSITQKEEKLVSNIQEIEKSRIEILKNISNESNIEFSELSMTKISEIIDDENVSQKIIKRRDELTGVLDQLKEINNKNTELIRQSLEVIDVSMKMMSNIMKGPQTYGKNRQDKTMNKSSVLIDREA